jgi:hypothetical protein
LGSAGENFSTGGDVLAVREGGELSSRSLNEYFMPGIYQSFCAGGSDAYAGFVIFDFFGNANYQAVPPWTTEVIQQRLDRPTY